MPATPSEATDGPATEWPEGPLEPSRVEPISLGAEEKDRLLVELHNEPALSAVLLRELAGELGLPDRMVASELCVGFGCSLLPRW
jgi:hypothetical protein